MTHQRKSWDGRLEELLPHFDQPFFQHASDFPFRHDLSRYSEVNAWWLAEAAGLAYLNEEKIKQRVRESLGDAYKVTFFQNQGTHTQGFLLSNHTFAILSLRGTEVALKADFPTRIENAAGMLHDIMTDLDVIQERWDGPGGVHGGFKKAFYSVYPQIRQALDHVSPTSIWVTGHSLGGGLAALAAETLHREDYPVRAMYTIGSARPGNPRFALRFPVPAYRFVHGRDIITLLSPDILFTQDYTPVGEMIYINEEGHIRSMGRHERHLLPFLAQELDLDLGAFLSGGWRGAANANILRLITQHSPIHYRNHLWNDMIS